MDNSNNFKGSRVSMLQKEESLGDLRKRRFNPQDDVRERTGGKFTTDLKIPIGI